MSRYQVPIGEDFSVDAVDIAPVEGAQPSVTEQAGLDTVRVRNKLAFLVLIAITAALGGAAILGLLQGNFDVLHAAWDRVTIPLGMVLGYYFTRKD